MAGREKCLLNLGDRSLLQHVIDRVQPQVSTLALNANGDPERFAPYGLPVLPDFMDGFLGPLAGIVTALRWVQKHADHAPWTMMVSSDTPFLPLTLVQDLKTAAGQADHASVVTPVSNGQRHSLCGLWRTDQADALEKAVREGGVRAIKDWLSDADIVDVDYGRFERDPFFNINTSEDLRMAHDFLS